MSPAGLSGAQISKRAQDFCRLVIEATHPPIQWDLGSFPVIKRPEHDAEQWPSSSTEVKNTWRYNSPYLICLHRVYRNLRTLFIYPESLTGRLVVTLQPTTLLTLQLGHFFVALIAVACMTMSCQWTRNTTYGALHWQHGLHDYSCKSSYILGTVTMPQLLQHISITCALNTELQGPEGKTFS